MLHVKSLIMTSNYLTENINYRLLSYTLTICALLFYGEDDLSHTRKNFVNIDLALALTRCISLSPGVPNIFLVKIKGIRGGNSAAVEGRVGYYGNRNLLVHGVEMTNTSAGIYIQMLNQITCQVSSGKTTDAILQFKDTPPPSSTTKSNGLASMISLALAI